MRHIAPAPANFNRVAVVYRWGEYLTLGPLLERTREYFIPFLSGRKNALVLGEGDGRFLGKLFRSNASVRATAVDASSRMLSLLEKRCRRQRERLTTIHGSALTVSAPPKTDLIVSHFFLDCLTQEQATMLVQQLSGAVQPGTIWLISDFEVPHSGILRWPASLYIRLLYLAFRVSTGLRITQLPDVASPLQRAGFRRTARRTFLFGILYTEVWEFWPTHTTPCMQNGEVNLSTLTVDNQTGSNAPA